MKFEIFQSKNGNYYFRIRARNGEIVAQSEGYLSRQSAEKTVASIKEEFKSPEIEQESFSEKTEAEKEVTE